ncbi:MAG: zinc ribbon domain-containing protein [bacterium]|nr:zinc ribbon domain-containing protein [bacterium]
MKVCRKCKSKNDLQARFCFQCGTRLSTTLTHSKLEMPTAHKVAIQTPLNLNDFIKHPLQKTSDVITSQNQGKQLSPKLQEKINKIAPSGLGKIDETKSTPTILDSSKVPLPLQLKHNVQDEIDETPSKLKISNRTRVKKIDEKSVRESKILNSNPKFHSDARSSRSDSEVKSSRLLSAEQKLRLSGRSKSNDQTNISSEGLRPKTKEFSLARLEQMEKQKREKLNKESRKKQLRHDLAYLDQVFPNEISELESRTEQSASPTKLSVDSNDSSKLQIQKNEKPIASLTSE